MLRWSHPVHGLLLADPDTMDFTVVESGLVPGRQCNFRAELIGAWTAIQHCSVATLYVDNRAVVDGLRRLQQHGWQPWYWEKAERLNSGWWRVW